MDKKLWKQEHSISTDSEPEVSVQLNNGQKVMTTYCISKS